MWEDDWLMTFKWIFHFKDTTSLAKKIKGAIKLESNLEGGFLSIYTDNPLDNPEIHICLRNIAKLLDDARGEFFFMDFNYLFNSIVEEEVVHYEMLPDYEPELLHNVKGFGTVLI